MSRKNGKKNGAGEARGVQDRPVPASGIEDDVSAFARADLVHDQVLRADSQVPGQPHRRRQRLGEVRRQRAESSPRVVAYARNDHLGFQVHYLWNGARRRYVPDSLVRLANGRTLVLEVKGEDSEQDRAKRAALDAWVTAVNSKGGFGIWSWDLLLEPARIHDVLDQHGVAAPTALADLAEP